MKIIYATLFWVTTALFIVSISIAVVLFVIATHLGERYE